MLGRRTRPVREQQRLEGKPRPRRDIQRQTATYKCVNTRYSLQATGRQSCKAGELELERGVRNYLGIREMELVHGVPWQQDELAVL